MAVVSDTNQQLGMARIEGVVVGLGGVAALFGVYWDDAWHTDIGRDSALAPPHLALYGGVALAGLAIASWGLRILVRTRSVAAAVRYRPLLMSAVGAVTILATGPLDAYWHSAYGRDAVLWSPPHIITVFASALMIAGLLGGIDDRRWPLFDEVLAGLLVGNLAVAVMEYETDVPQFSEVFYLPVAVCAALLAARLARCITGHRYAVIIMVAGYLTVRLGITAVLTAMGRTAPDLPIAYLGLLLIDLPVWRTNAQRYAAGAAGFTVLALAASALDLASQSPGPLVPSVVVAMAALGVALALNRGPRTAVAAIVLAVLVAGSWSLLPATPAAAHDPGQGEEVGQSVLTISSDGSGGIAVAVEVPDNCADVEPVRVLARRDGSVRTADLGPAGNCRFESALRVPGPGRWFVYAEMRAAGEAVEVWLPVQADRAGSLTERRSLYRPSGSAGISGAEAIVGVVVYAVGIALVAWALWKTRCRHGDPQVTG